MTGASKPVKSISAEDSNICRNPFEIDVILRLIFSYSSVEDLKAVRLVNSQWLEISYDFWRKKAVVKVTPSRRIQTDLMSIHWLHYNYSKPGAKHFLNMKWRDDSLPLSQVCRTCLAPLTYLELDSCTLRGTTGFFQLLTRVPSLTTLKLTQAAIFVEASYVSRRGAAMINNPSHQNLRSLEMGLIGTPTARLGLEEFIVTALPLLPNLEGLLVKTEFPDHMLGFSAGISNLSTQRLPRLKKLDVLELNGASVFNGFNFTLFANGLEEYGADISERRLTPFVRQNICFSLKKLRLGMNPRGDLFRQEGNFLVDGFRASFPILETLRLEMDKSYAYQFLQDVEMPVLSRLEFLECNIDPHLDELDLIELPQIEYPPLPFVQLPTLKILKIDCGMDYVEIPELQRFCEAMPMLEELEMCLTKDTFPVVCKHWKGLRVLKVLSLSGFALEELAVDDEAVTGLSEGMELVSADNITSLERLMYFTLEVSGVVGNLTDVSVKHGFLKLKYLYWLEFCMDKVSAEAKKLLQDSVPVLKEAKRSPDT